MAQWDYITLINSWFIKGISFDSAKIMQNQAWMTGHQKEEK